jgi:hypothetical protein
LARDTVFAAAMLIHNGIIGLFFTRYGAHHGVAGRCLPGDSGHLPIHHDCSSRQRALDNAGTCGAPDDNHLEIAGHYSMKITRLYQPRNPLFWIMLALNLLSLVLGWLTRSYALTTVGSLLVTAFAVGNALLGTYLAWRLIRS